MMVGGYDRSREGLAEGCCSARAPCSHQQKAPSSICYRCTEAHLLAAHAQGLMSMDQVNMALAAWPRPPVPADDAKGGR